MAQENPFSKYAQPSQGVVFRDPYADDEQRREEERLANERRRVQLAEEAASRDAQRDAQTIERENRELSDKERESARLRAAQASGINDALYQIDGVINAAREARTMALDGSGIGSLEGKPAFRDSLLLSLFGANASSNDMEALLNTVGSNTAFDRLQRMRDESPTGGALGAVSEIELKLLRDSIASLSQTQSEGQFREAMDRVIEAYGRVGAKLRHAQAYEQETGSMDGYVPLSNEQLLSRIAPSGEPGGFDAAGSGATETSIPVPQEMQDEYASYISQNWGNLDAGSLADFVGSLELKYDRPVGVPDYSGFVEQANTAAREGAGPEVVGPIPATNRDLSGFEQVRNDVISSPLGTGVASAANATTGGLVDALSGGKMDAAQELNPWSGFIGDAVGATAGTLATGGLLSAGGRAAGFGKTLLDNPLAADAAYGGIYGALESDDPLLGAVMGSGMGLVGGKAGDLIGGALPRITGVSVPQDTLGRGERAVMGILPRDEAGAPQIDPVVQALSQAGDLNVPMTLADASPELSALGGSTVRYSPTSAGTAREVMARRNDGQLDRLADAVERDLGPVGNIAQRSDDLLQQARTNAGPLYDQAYAAPGAENVEIMDLMNRPSFAPALREAYKIAQEEGVDPRIYGFVMDEAGEVNIDPNAFGGRYSRAPVDSELNYLESRTFRTPKGGTVQKRGPVDLVGWLRLSGGLKDSGGELKHMGLTNKGRGKSAILAGRETEFGPLLDDIDGMNFDDAALAAWEAGFFPELSDRPDVNTFLNALRDTAEGIDQRFRSEDMADVERYLSAQEQADAVRRANGEGGGMWDDASIDAGADRPFAPPEAYGDTEAMTGLSFEALDQVKRGLDAIIERETDPVTGTVSSYGRNVIGTKQTLLARIDEANPVYADARRAYAGPAQERDFLRQGQQAVTGRADELETAVSGLSPEQLAQMRLGFQGETMERAGNLRGNSNPFAQLNTPNTERRLQALYNGSEDADIARLLSQRDLELRLAGSANRLIGNSATAEREVSDAFFERAVSGGGNMPLAVAETAMTGGPWLTAGKSILDRFIGERRQRAAAEGNRALADDLGPLMFNDDPAASADILADLVARGGQHDADLIAAMQEARRRANAAGSGLAFAGMNSEVY